MERERDRLLQAQRKEMESKQWEMDEKKQQLELQTVTEAEIEEKLKEMERMMTKTGRLKWRRKNKETLID